MPTAFVQAQPDVTQLVYANHGKLLLASDTDGNVTFWDTVSKTQLGRLNNVGRLVRADENGTLVLFCDYGPKSPTKRIPFVSRLTLIHFPLKGFDEASLQDSTERWTISGAIKDELPDLSRMIVVEPPNALVLIDTQTRKVLSRRSFDKKQYLSGARFSRNGRFLLLPDIEDNALILNAADLTTFRKLPPLSKVVFSNDGQYIAGSNFDGDFQSWNIKTGKHVTKQTHLSNLTLWDARDDNHFVMFGEAGDKTYQKSFRGIYSAEGNLLTTLKKGVYLPQSTKPKWRIRLQGYESSGAYYLNAAVPYADVANLMSGKIVHRLNTVTDILGNERAWNASGLNGRSYGAISPDGSQAAVSTADGMIRFYDFNAQHSPQPVLYKSNSGGRIVYPDGSEPSTDRRSNDLIYNGYTILADGSVMVRSGATGAQKLIQYKPSQKMYRSGHIYSLANISYSPQRTKVLIYWTRDQEEEKKAGLPGASIRYDILNNLFEVRNVKDNRLLHTLDTPQHLFYRFSSGTPVWSSDGKRIALTNGGGCIFVYDVDSGLQISYLSGAHSQHYLKNWIHEEIPGGLISLVFSPDDKYIAASRGDGTIYLYSLQKQMPIAQIGKISGGVGNLQFSSDGRLLYGVNHYQVRTWNMPELKP